MLSLYEILKASKTGIAPDMWTALAGMNWSGADSGHEVKELTGIPPLSIRSNGTMLLDYLISGNMSQTGTPTPTTPIQPQETGERAGNLFDLDTWLTDKGISYTRIGSEYTITGNAVLYTQPYYFSESNIDISISAIIETVTADSPRIDLIAADGTPVLNGAISENIAERTGISCAGLRLNWSTNGVFKIKAPMINTGSTPIPYEPWGIKIPISSGGENLCPMIFSHRGVVDDNGGVSVQNTRLWTEMIPVSASSSYYVAVDGVASNDEVLRFNRAIQYDDSGTFISRINTGANKTATFTTAANCAYIVLDIRTMSLNVNLSETDVNSIQMNRGSTALPYEPYNRTTTPIYLGEVPTTRRIRKLVLDGTENFDHYGSGVFWVKAEDNNAMINGYGVSNSYVFNPVILNVPTTIANNEFCLTSANGRLWIRNTNYSNADGFKSYLAAQYANGTPVTIWYVLATPTTGIVNEPLRKIGDYADTISMEQAGVQIPTVKGNTAIDVETTLKPSEMYIKYQE